jgi:hypothetical protein
VWFNESMSTNTFALIQITSQPSAAVQLLGELLPRCWNRPKQVQPPRPSHQHVYYRFHSFHVYCVSFAPIRSDQCIAKYLTLNPSPFITDKYGRKPCIVLGCIFMIIGCIINTAAQDYAMFCVGRFILGFGNSLSQLTSPMLLTEVVHPQHRAPFTTIYNCLWNLGSFCMLTHSILPSHNS